MEAGQQVRIFLMNDAVDLARDACRPPENCDQDLTQMLKDLIASQEALVGTLYAILPAAQAAGDEVSASLISDRLTAHEKHIWMLRSSL